MASQIKFTGTGFEHLLVVPDNAGPNSYTVTWTVPAGATAQDDPQGVQLVAEDGTVLGSFGSGTATDAASPAAAAPVVVALAGQSGTTVLISVTVDRGWMQDPARVFPVTIDPTWVGGTYSSGSDTYVSSANSGTSYWGATALKVGTNNAGTDKNRTFLKFTPGLVNANYGVVSASLGLYVTGGTTCTARPMDAYGLAASFGSGTTWANQPALDDWGSEGTSWFNYGFSGSCPAQAQYMDITGVVQRWFDGTQTNNGIALQSRDEGWDNGSYKTIASEEGGGIYLNPTLSITYQTVPSAPTMTSPTDTAIVTTTSPTLQVNAVTDPDTSGSVRYWFRVWTTGDKLEHGQALDSGWITNTTWTPDSSYIQNGVTYYWHVYATDESGAHVTLPAYNSFSVDQMLGGIRTDTVGPVSVNLTTGNASVNVDAMANAFRYNSQDVPAPRGLRGYYYTDTNNNQSLPPDDNLVQSRVDPALQFNWDGTSPMPGVGEPGTNNRAQVQWKGKVAVPTTGTYYFGAMHDDRVKITVNGTVVLNRWSANTVSYFADFDATGVALTANTPVTVVVDYFNDTGQALLALWQYKSGGNTALLPPSWLTPDNFTTSALPQGWTFSGPLAGTSVYPAATVTNDRVTLRSASGDIVEFTRAPNGEAWNAPDGHSELILTENSGGGLTLQSPGMVYQFSKDGTLESQTSASEMRNPASTTSYSAPTYTWRQFTTGSPAYTYTRLDAIHDPVANRDITFEYNDGTMCGSAPVGMLCEIDYWDGTATTVTYSSGRLARITNPGSAITDFYYNANGALTDIRDPLAADAVAATIRTESAAVHWVIGYDTSTPPRATSVTAPAPVTDASPRPAHTYTYNSGNTLINRAGAAPASGYFRKVVFDSKSRLTEDYDASGRFSQATWDTDKNRVKWVDGPADSAGVKLRSSWVYDAQGRVIDTYGPAPHGWFAGTGVPEAAYLALVPNTHQNYDEGLESLGVTWWETADWTGKPVATDLGVGTAGGEIDKTWGASQPTGVSVANGWSGMLTGTITFPTAGVYSLQIVRDGKVGLFLDASQLGDPTMLTTSGTTNLVADTPTVTAGSTHRISIWYGEGNNTTAKLKLKWKTPGSGSYATIPGTNLNPGLNLPTSATDADGDKAAKSYANPLLGLATASTRDPDAGGLQLSTSVEYNAPSNQVSKVTMPSGTADNTQTTYWGGTDLPTGFSNPCGSTGIKQAGLVKTTTGPTPATGSAITHDAVYDNLGRPLGQRTNTDAWSCMTYDTRGRLTQRTIPSFGAEAANTTTYNYAVSSNPLVSSVTDAAGTMTATVDLLGRPVSATDVWGKTTTTTYNQVGQRTGTNWNSGASTQGWAYADDGQVTSMTLDGLTVATVAYDSYTGRPLSYSYPPGTGKIGNGTSSRGLDSSGNRTTNIQYDSLGRSSGIAWVESGGTNVITSDQLTAFTVAGRITDRKIDGTDPNTGGANYTYDNAGRLTTAYSAGAATPLTTYNFAGSGGCGANAAAGKNTNRTSMVNGSQTVTYCYDNADRFTTATDNATPQNTFSATYDTHGNTASIIYNTVTIETHSYDADNRHMATTSGSMTVRYTRDASGAIVERKENGATIARYSGNSVLNASNTLIARTVALPGGAMVTKQTSGDVWSYPNAQGHMAATANSTGVKTGSTLKYDAYGNELAGTIDNAPGAFDIGWSGQQSTEHATGMNFNRIEMGAREYLPVLGRFLSVDPVKGGSANDYEYGAGDPLNRSDYGGTCIQGPPGIYDCLWQMYVGMIRVAHAFANHDYMVVQETRSWGPFTVQVGPTVHFGPEFTAGLKLMSESFRDGNPAWKFYVYANIAVITSLIGLAVGAIVTAATGPGSVIGAATGFIAGVFLSALFAVGLDTVVANMNLTPWGGCFYMSPYSMGPDPCYPSWG